MTTRPSIEEAISKTQADAIEAARRQGLGRLLLLARENFFTRMEQKITDMFSASSLRTSGTLLPFIDVQGTRSTEVARRLGVSKQAVGRSIKILLDEGLVEFVNDPGDGRAFLVRYTRAGIKRLSQTHEAIRRVEQDLERELGAERFRTTRDVLFEMAYGESGGVPLPQQTQGKRGAGSGKSGRR